MALSLETLQPGLLGITAVRKILRLVPGTRALALRRDLRDRTRLARADFAFVSFPKSGRTFVRVMLSHLFQQKYGLDQRQLIGFANFHRMNRHIPRILFTHDGDAMRRPNEIPRDKRGYDGKAVALIVRHPADVAVSRHFHLKHRSRDAGRRRLAEQPIGDFVWTPRGGIPSIVEFMNGWVRMRDRLGPFAIFRFEDFRSDTAASLATLAAFVGVGSTAAEIDQAVAFARFDSLREKERQGFFASSRLGPRQDGGEASFKVRSGTAGGYRHHLDAAGIAAVEQYLLDHLDPLFGYRAPPDRS